MGVERRALYLLGHNMHRYRHRRKGGVGHGISLVPLASCALTIIDQSTRAGWAHRR